MTMQAPAPQATAAAAPPPGAPAAPPAPAPGAATGAGPVAALQQAATKLQAVIAAAQAAGGALPANAAGELAAVCQAIQGATGAAAAPPAAAPPAPPKPPAPPGAGGGAPPQFGKNDGVQKMELDDWTAMKVTLDAARERMWGVSDALRDGDTDAAKTELKGVIAMLSSLKGDAMKGETTTVKMDKAGFAAWTQAQFEAMKTDAIEVATERLATVKRVTAIAKASWEQTGSEGTKPFTVEMMTAFAPEKEKTMDITAKEDQSEKETPAAKDTPDAKGTFAHNLGEVIKDVQSALTMTKQPENGSTIAFANPDAPAKSPTEKGAGKEKTEKADEGFVWPMDMNDPDAGKAFDEPDPKAKRPADAEDGWGKDPWASK